MKYHPAILCFNVKEWNFNGGTLQALIKDMKTTNKIIIAIGIASLAAVPLMAGPPVTIRIGTPLPPPPVIVVPAPPPAVMVNVGVPDNYVWDGYEFVGVVGDQYYYLGPGNVWLALDAPRLMRWHHWEKAHADWRAHATVNVKYRLDAKGHEHPWHKDHGH